MTHLRSTNPIAAVAVPIAVFVAANAFFAHLGGVHVAAAAPAPADGAQMVAASGLEADRADDAAGQGAGAGLALPVAIVFVADVAKFNGHAIKKRLETGD